MLFDGKKTLIFISNKIKQSSTGFEPQFKFKEIKTNKVDWAKETLVIDVLNPSNCNNESSMFDVFTGHINKNIEKSLENGRHWISDNSGNKARPNCVHIKKRSTSFTPDGDSEKKVIFMQFFIENIKYRA